MNLEPPKEGRVSASYIATAGALAVIFVALLTMSREYFGPLTWEVLLFADMALVAILIGYGVFIGPYLLRRQALLEERKRHVEGVVRMLESVSSKVSNYDFSEPLHSWGDVILEPEPSTLEAEYSRVFDWYDAARRRVKELIRDTAKDNIPKTSAKKGQAMASIILDFAKYLAEPLIRGSRVGTNWARENEPEFIDHLTSNRETDENIDQFFKDLNWRVQEDNITKSFRTEHRRLLEMMSRTREATQARIK